MLLSELNRSISNNNWLKIQQVRLKRASPSGVKNEHSAKFRPPEPLGTEGSRSSGEKTNEVQRELAAPKTWVEETPLGFSPRGLRRKQDEVGYMDPRWSYGDEGSAGESRAAERNENGKEIVDSWKELAELLTKLPQ